MIVQYFVISDENWEHMKRNFPKWANDFGIRKYKFEKERDVNNFINDGRTLTTKLYAAIIEGKIVNFESSIYAIYNEGKLTFKSKGFEEIQNFRLPPELQSSNY